MKRDVLRIRPAPHAGESLLGFLQRLAKDNLCDRVSRVTDLAGIDIKKAIFGQDDLAKLAAICLVDVSELRRMSYAAEGDRMATFLGHMLRRERIRIETGKVCGPCLADAGYRRTVWDLAFAFVCPKHGLELVSSCQECCSAFDWSVASATRCRCGADLAKQHGAPVSPEDAQAVIAVLEPFTGSFENRGRPLSPVVAGLPPGEAVELIMFAGRHQVNLATGEDLSGRLSPRQSLSVLRSGLDLCRNWPAGFYDLLDRYRHAGGKQPHPLAKGAPFSKVYQTICDLSEHGWGTVVRTAFREYAWQNPEVLFAGRSRLLEGLAEEKGYIDASDAAHMICVGRSHLCKMLALPQAKGIRTVSHSYYLLVNKQDIEAHAWTLADPIRLSELGRRLGIEKKKVLRDIRNAGVFATQPYHQASTQFPDRVLVLGSDVDGFLEGMDAAVEHACLPKKTVSFDGAVEEAKRYGVGTAQLLSMMKSGDLKPVGIVKNAVGVHKYLLDLDELKARLEEFTECRTGTMSIARAAVRLRLRLDVAYDLVKLGLLPGARSKKPTLTDVFVPLPHLGASSTWTPPSVAKQLFEMRVPIGLRIPLSALSAYEEEFVDLPCIARNLGVDSRIVRKLLASVAPGVEPVAHAGRLKIAIYRRADIDMTAVKRAARRHKRKGNSRRSNGRQASQTIGTVMEGSP